jgi:DNA-binding GntR family transcriptional regulator
MVESTNLSRIAYDRILNSIITGRIKLGSPVSQNAFSKILPMSRTPIREALFALEHQGLLVKDGNKYFVSFISKEDIVQLYEVRKILEGNAARLCAEKINSNQRKSLAFLMRTMKMQSESKDAKPEDIASLNGHLHEMIAEIAGNAYLKKFIDETLLQLKIVRISLLVSMERRSEEFKDHQQIIQAILDSDPRRAQEAMEKHEEAVLDFAEKTAFKKLYVE